MSLQTHETFQLNTNIYMDIAKMKWKFSLLMTFFIRFDKKNKLIEILLEIVCYSYWLKVSYIL